MGVEEGNSLKNHYVTKECVHGSMFKGPRVWGDKEGFVGADLAAWQADGRALFPSGLSCLARFDFHSSGVKVGAAPGAPKGSYCVKVCSLSRSNACALLTSQHLHTVPFYSLMFHLSINPVLGPFGFEACVTTSNNGCSHMDYPVWQIP